MSQPEYAIPLWSSLCAVCPPLDSAVALPPTLMRCVRYSFLNEFCHFGDASLRDAVGASGGAVAADLDGEGDEADA